MSEISKLVTIAAKCRQWIDLAPIDNWGETSASEEDAALASAGRTIIAIIAIDKETPAP